jgi:hypothetical protein
MRIRSLRTAAAAVAVLALTVAAAPASAATTRVNVPTVAAKQITRIADKSPLAIYLPNAFTIHGRHQAFPSASIAQGSWTLDLAYARNCNGANVCSMASFSALKRKRLFDPANVTLAKGVQGHFYPLSCGASCSPAQIHFVRDGVLYQFSVKDPVARPKAALVALANQAINYGPR